MRKSKLRTRLLAAVPLIATAGLPPVLVPLTPASAQGYSPMPPACQAASAAAQAENAQFSQPPADSSIVVQTQHILYMTGLLIDSLDQSCRDWADYGRTRQQFQSTYDATMKTCLQIATNSADCRRKPYGS